ncbi:MAG: hypothetical protein PHW65_04965, partial [Dehalococcoidales bacterium]|nr:hypothetical protein [Dehalococcoidales bacterium]
MAKVEDVTQEWTLYQAGLDFNDNIGLGETVDENERMYAGDQWNGVVSNGLPTPVFNIFKRIINYFIAAIMSSNIKMKFTPENIGEPLSDQDLEAIGLQQIAELMTANSDTLWENLKMNNNIRQWLLDAALSGDACAYVWFNAATDTGQEIATGVYDELQQELVEPIKGELEIELPDNVNVFFGNPNDTRVERQPYILIAFRELVKKLREEAKANGVSKEDIKNIVGDRDYEKQSGDLAKYELNSSSEESDKATALIKLWKQNGTVWFTKSTRAVVIRKAVGTKAKLYPVAWMNWDKRKNCYHGQAVATGLIPNQIFINKMFAMVMLNLMQTAFPKLVYDASVIKKPSNQIGEAIAVQGGTSVRDVATYLQAGEMSSRVMEVINAAISFTKSLIGAEDAALGNIKPENHSAIIAVQQAAAIPLETIKANLYQFIEDIGNIWIDQMAVKYGTRSVTVMVPQTDPMTGETKTVRQAIPFDFSKLQNIRLKLKVEVG